MGTRHNALAFLSEGLNLLARDGMLRVRSPAPAAGAVSYCTNDYLGLAGVLAESVRSGSGASRLLGGERPEHGTVESAAADLVGLPEALAFTSGYAANVGAVSALAGPDDLIVSDALNHASLVDGARLSRARICVIPHLDAHAALHALEAPRTGRAFLLTESYFSMDADGPDLRLLRRICDEHETALVVDEAHALGVLGPEGRGLCAAAGVTPDVLTGTFGKAFGAGGAFVAGSRELIQWLWNRARSFVFSTGLSPVVAAAAAAGIRCAEREPARRARTLENADRLRHGLRALGVPVRGFGHIVPWFVGDAGRAMSLAASLQSNGVDVRAVRPPTVPEGTSRLRFSVTAEHDEAAIDLTLAAIRATLEAPVAGRTTE